MVYVSPNVGWRIYLEVVKDSLDKALREIKREDLIQEEDDIFSFFVNLFEYANPLFGIQKKLKYMQKDLRNKLTESEWELFSEKYEYHLRKSTLQILRWYFFAIRIILKLFGIGVDDLIEVGLSLISKGLDIANQNMEPTVNPPV